MIIGKPRVKKEDLERKKLKPSDVHGFRTNPITKKIYAYVGDDVEGNPVEVEITKYQMNRLK